MSKGVFFETVQEQQPPWRRKVFQWGHSIGARISTLREEKKPVPVLLRLKYTLADDGEILIRGDNVFTGYWKMPEETAEAFTEDGFLMSGDIGAFGDAGFLTITDRKKNLIITSGGQNIAPQKIASSFSGLIRIWVLRWILTFFLSCWTVEQNAGWSLK